jgi:hypothetical protein
VLFVQLSCNCVFSSAHSHHTSGLSIGSASSSYSDDDSSSSGIGVLPFIGPIIFGVIVGLVFLWRWQQMRQQSALVSSIEPVATQIVGYPGAVQMAPAPIAGVAMYDGNMVTTKTYSAGAHAPVPVGYVHTGNPGYDGQLQYPQHPQQYQPYGGAFGVPVQQQQPPHGAPVQYMHRPDQHQQQSLPQSNAGLPPSIGSTTRAVAPEAKPAFFSPGGANAQQQPQQLQQPYSHSLPGQVAPSNADVSGTSFVSAPQPSYAFAAPAGSFAPSAPPPAYTADDSGYNSNAQIGQEYAPQPPQPSYL